MDIMGFEVRLLKDTGHTAEVVETVMGLLGVVGERINDLLSIRVAASDEFGAIKTTARDARAIYTSEKGNRWVPDQG